MSRLGSVEWQEDNSVKLRLNIWPAIEAFLLENGISILTFPDIETDERFWLVKQPDPAPIAKDATLEGALRKAGLFRS